MKQKQNGEHKQLNDEEYKILKSQFVISSWGGIRRANPYAFTEQGVAMLSSVGMKIGNWNINFQNPYLSTNAIEMLSIGQNKLHKTAWHSATTLSFL